MSLQLESPSLRLKDSYLSHVEEFRQRGEWPIPFVLKFPTDDFPAFIARLEQCALGAEITPDHAPHETFWLVEDGVHVVGVSNLRLSLTDSLRRDGGNIGYGIRPSARRRGLATLILKETLLKAQARGITRALVTANKGNIGSIKTILKNGGAYDSEELLPGYHDIMQRFWITVPGLLNRPDEALAAAGPRYPSPPPYYHGTRADLKVGDIIRAGYSSNYGTRRQANHVYFSATLNAAAWGAELAVGEGPGRIYVVEPTGPFLDDPNVTDRKFPGNPTKSYRSRQPVRVVGEVKEWPAHTAEELKTMKDFLERLKQQGIEAVDD